MLAEQSGLGDAGEDALKQAEQQFHEANERLEEAEKKRPGQKSALRITRKFGTCRQKEMNMSAGRKSLRKDARTSRI